MKETNYRISAFQLFFLVFAYVFSGLFLYAKASLTVTVLSCTFAAAICVVAGYLCRGFSSSAQFYGAVFGRFSAFVRLLSLIFIAFSGVRALYAFSRGICVYYKGASVAAVFLICAFLAVFAVFRSFSGAARFAELGAFVVAAILLLSFLGGGGDVYFFFSADEVLSSFDAFGSSAVILSLYLRVITKDDAEMSDFARNAGTHPSPVLCGVFGALFAGALYLFICVRGGMSNILLLLFAWLLCITGFFALALCASDVLGIPECEKENALRRAMFFALICAVRLLSDGLFPEYLRTEASAVYNVILPCALFAVFWARERRTSRADVNK